jgi:hypothetical protein
LIRAVGIEDHHPAITTFGIGIGHGQLDRHPTIRQKGVHAVERDPFQVQRLRHAGLGLSVKKPAREKKEA